VNGSSMWFGGESVNSWDILTTAGSSWEKKDNYPFHLISFCPN